jgi:hypothetical protein
MTDLPTPSDRASPAGAQGTPDPRAWCALAAATAGAAPQADARADAAAGAARILAAAERAAARSLRWDAALLPFGPVLQQLATGAAP